MQTKQNSIVSLFDKHCGNLTTAELVSLGIINRGILFEYIEEKLRGGKRHVKANEKGSDITMPNGDLVEVKYVQFLTRLVKNKNRLREIRRATINRLATKSCCRLVVYVHDVDNDKVVRFELKRGWEDEISICKAGSTCIHAPKHADILTHDGAGVFNSSLHYVKPILVC